MNKLAFFAILHWHPTRVTAREPPDSVKYFRDKDSLPACMKMKELGKRSETKTTTMISKAIVEVRVHQTNLKYCRAKKKQRPFSLKIS